jgi:predicted O-methyltransferase YrrM
MDRLEMSVARWDATCGYVRALFAREDEHQRGVMERAKGAGMPPIDAGPETGRLLQMLVMLTGGILAIEVGTLAGSSSIWMARGLAAGGRLITVELSATHAEFARREIDRAGLGERVTIRQGRGAEVVPKLLRELAAGSAGLVFLDAERSEYPALVDPVHTLLKPGGVMAVDNALAAKRWTADPVPPGEEPDQMDTFNRLMSRDARFECTLLPVGNGVLVCIKR